jgi:hypothetical protein
MRQPLPGKYPNTVRRIAGFSSGCAKMNERKRRRMTEATTYPCKMNDHQDYAGLENDLILERTIVEESFVRAL